jgi:hypothetical protein
VLLIPVVPTSSDHNPVFIPETAEWPPSQFTLRVFSSKAWRWEERTFLREGMCAGTVADMRRLQEEIVDGWLGLAKMHQSVYWDGALYVSCGGNFFMRYVATGLFNDFVSLLNFFMPPLNFDFSSTFPFVTGCCCCSEFDSFLLFFFQNINVDW